MRSRLQTLTLSTLLVVACGGGSLRPGESTVADVLRTWGEPALQRQDIDGTTRLFYPSGAFGTQTFVVRIDAAGGMLSVENVLDTAHFAAIKPGMEKEQVLRLLGPPQPNWTVYFESRDELAWEWRYCDWNASARFAVLFDATRGLVRSTLSVREDCGIGDCPCPP